MATISPVFDLSLSRAPRFSWPDITTTTDTPVAQNVSDQCGLAGVVQFSGTFNGGTTAVLQGSVNGTDYVTLKDIFGNSISCTAAAMFEFSTSCPYIKPAVSGGSSDNVTVTVCLRG